MADEDKSEETTLSDDLKTLYDELSDDEGSEATADKPAEDAENPTEAVDEEKEEETAEPEKASDEESDADKDVSEEEDKPLEAPEHWNEADREAFSELPDDAKPLYLDKVKSLEAGYKEKFTAIADDRKLIDRYKPMDEVFAPYRQQLQMAGLDEVSYTQQLMSIAGSMRQNPAGTIKWLAEQNGVDLNTLVANPEADFTDPAVTEIKNEIGQIKSSIQQQANQAQNASVQDAQAAITAFQTAADEQGNLKHPHFDKVSSVMGALFQSGTAQTLEDAYDRAVKADPELGNTLIETQVKTALEQQQAEKKKAVDKAKKASKNPPKRKAPATDTPTEAASVKAELERNWDQMSA